MVGGLELRLQIGEPFAHVGKSFVRRAIYLGMSGYFVESLLKSDLDALNLRVDLDQAAVLGIVGDSCGQPVSFLSSE